MPMFRKFGMAAAALVSTMCLSAAAGADVIDFDLSPQTPLFGSLTVQIPFPPPTPDRDRVHKHLSKCHSECPSGP
jgi:hypothetical protein